MIDIPGYLDATPVSRRKNAIKNGKIGMIRWIMSEGKYEYDEWSPRIFDILYDLSKDRLLGLMNKTNNTSKVLPLIKVISEPNSFY